VSFDFFSFSSDARVVLRCAVRALGTISCGSSSSCDGGAAGGCCDDRRELRRVAGCGGGAVTEGAGCAGGGDSARFLLVDFEILVDVLFFARAAAGSGSSFSGSVAAVFARFAPRVKTKSPSCSSYATITDVSPHGPLLQDRRSDSPARRLLFRRCGSLPILKTCKGCRVRTSVVMDGRVGQGVTTSIRLDRVPDAGRLAPSPPFAELVGVVAMMKTERVRGARTRRVKLVSEGKGAC
jgi:hypothetical protein